MISGRYPDAARLNLEAREVAATTEDVLAQLLYYPTQMEIYRRVGIRPEEYAEIKAQIEFALGMPVAVVQMGLLALTAGDSPTAATMLDRLRAALPEHPRNSRWLPTLAMAGELAARLGDPEIAALCYERLRPYEALYVNSATGCHGSVARDLGVMAGVLGDHDAADRHLTAATTQERRIGSLGDAAMVQVDHAAALLARGAPGDRDRALDLAGAAARAAAELGMLPVRQRAESLAGRLAGERDDPLTAREREIAALVAEGHPNRVIAQRLFLSERTVETHVRNLLTKLGLANRTQVAGWVMRSSRGTT
jgi:DNA-binding CsgD family transcriptional regulator